MSVLYAYAGPPPLAASAAASNFASKAEHVDTSADPYAFWGEIVKRWKGEEDLTIIEGDIEIDKDVISEFDSCPSLWCVRPYQIHTKGTWLDFGLGCVRFRAALQLLVSPEDIQKQPGECELCGGAPGCWRHLDCKICWALQAVGQVQHVHPAAVEHHSLSVANSEDTDEVTWFRIAGDVRQAA